MTDVNPDIDLIPTVLRPRPVASVAGRRVAFFSTATPASADLLADHLRDAHEADVTLVSTDLAGRAALRDAVAAAADRADVFLTEIKAAAVDVVAEAAARMGKELVFCDNEPVAAAVDRPRPPHGRRRRPPRRQAAAQRRRYAARQRS